MVISMHCCKLFRVPLFCAFMGLQGTKVNNLQWTNQKEEDHKNDGEENVGSGQRNKTYIQRLRNYYPKNDRHIQGVHSMARNFWSSGKITTKEAGTNCIRSTFRLELETVTQMPLVLRHTACTASLSGGSGQWVSQD
ncbi:hypothetical protein C0J52_04211 [Blattella germanica]|nr:hypothetical protein C0J52_04211 [Blattella germanica]